MNIRGRVEATLTSATLVETGDAASPEISYRPDDLKRVEEAYRRFPAETLEILEQRMRELVNEAATDPSAFYVRARVALALQRKFSAYKRRFYVESDDGLATLDTRPLWTDPYPPAQP